MVDEHVMMNPVRVRLLLPRPLGPASDERVRLAFDEIADRDMRFGSKRMLDACAHESIRGRGRERPWILCNAAGGFRVREFDWWQYNVRRRRWGGRVPNYAGRTPLGTGRSGCTRTIAPSASGKPVTSTSDRNGPIYCAGS